MRYWNWGGIKSLIAINPAVIIIFGCLSFVSCDQTSSPKPKGYFRIDLPEKKYKTYSESDCPFEFDLPPYAVVTNYHDSVSQPCWKYVQFPGFNSEIFLSYKKVEGDLTKLLEDSRTLAYKHTVKASAIDETIIITPNHVSGMIYDIGGNAASSVQFYATDSTNHFIRGALYFNVAPQPDSLAPVIQFLREDIVRMVTSLKWK